MTAKEAILTLLQGGDPPQGEYDGWRSVVDHLRRMNDLGARERLYNQLKRGNPSLVALMDTPQSTPEENTESKTADSATDGLGANYLPLPEGSRIDSHLGVDACKWLDTYIAWSKKWAPEAFEEAHEVCGLFILSTIAARRVFIPFGPGGQYTNLTLALVARTTQYTKSTVANLAKFVIRSIGLGYLLGPDKSTPEKMVSNMAARFDLTGYETWSDEDQEKMRNRMAFSAQRAWCAEEFGMHLKAMMQDSGPYAALYGLMLIADDCQPEYEVETIGRGTDRVKNLYFPVLACMTPANLKKAGKQGDDIWEDGYMARFGFGVPQEPLTEGEFPEELFNVPASISGPLIQWHKRLGIPVVTVEPEYDEKGKKVIKYNVKRGDLLAKECTLGTSERKAIYRYRGALRKMVAKSNQTKTDGNYGRLSTLMVRIAGAFASLEGEGHISMGHLARAQIITERMRVSLHRLLNQIEDTPTPSYARKAENKIVGLIQKLARMGEKTTLRTIYTWGNMSAPDARMQVQALVDMGVLEEAKEGRAVVYRIAKQESATG